MIVLVNQHTIPLFIDVVNAFASSPEDAVLFTGHVEEGGVPVSSKVRLIKSKAYHRKSALTRLISWTLFTIHYTLYLCQWKKPGKIVVTTNPPFAPVVTMVISRLRRIPYYIILYDLYPDALSQATLLKDTNLFFKWWALLNSTLFRRATRIFTLSESMSKAVTRYTPLAQVTVIHNWADTSYIKPIRKLDNPFVTRHNLQDKTVVLYSGNMGLTHDLESLIEAAAILKQEKDLVFLLIGEGGKRNKLEEMVQNQVLSNVIFLPYQDKSNFPLAMAAADIGVVTLGKGAEGISVPSKTYITMAAGLCILTIAPQESELARLVKQYNVGITCEPGNGRRVADMIRSISVPAQLEEYKIRSLKAAENFTPQNAKQYVRKVTQS
jgi:glycosyltransferase involved in cell wall biosynthesis